MLSLIQKISNLLFWQGIAASPFIAGAILAFFVYEMLGSTIGMILGIIILFSGLVGGIMFAEYVRKKKGTANFMGKLTEFSTGDNKKGDF